MIPVFLNWYRGRIKGSAFLDSGTAGNFWDFGFVRKHYIPFKHQNPSLRLSAIDDYSLGSGVVSSKSRVLHMSLRNHSELLLF